MTNSIFSSSWYRVSALRPRLRSHAQIHRHQYRGETWYVLEELTAERFFRFSTAAYFVIGLMDGQSTVDEIWERACSRLGDEAPTQDEIIGILSQLYQADVLQCNVSPDTAELLDRNREQSRRRWMSRVFSVFSWRFSLLDPDQGLQRVLPAAKVLFSWFGAIIWLVVVIPGVVLLATHWSDLTQDVFDRLLVPNNIVFLWLLFPIIKTLHEFGHALATKAFGGQVHDMGE
ncbi:MAG: hypothetical protein HY313_10425 [Acidobacteria bacterium]|nr:hypothetical protein [Acidobacteriota bacterium]